MYSRPQKVCTHLKFADFIFRSITKQIAPHTFNITNKILFIHFNYYFIGLQI